MHELDDPPAPSNDVDDGERRALAALGRGILADALARPSLSREPLSYVPAPEEQKRLRSLFARALGAALAADADRDEEHARSGPPPGWEERVMSKIEELEAARVGPVSGLQSRGGVRPPG